MFFVFLSTGIDTEGHAANYVETEQIVQHNNAKASFVQVNQDNNASVYTDITLAILTMLNQPILHCLCMGECVSILSNFQNQIIQTITANRHVLILFM